MGEDRAVTTPPSSRWTGGLGSFWAAHDGFYETMLARLTEPILDAAGVGPGQRVLDVGCGAGRTTREAARRAGPDGSALGVDVAPAMVERARERAAAEGPGNVAYVVADAGSADLLELAGGPVDALISRFGLLFFPDPPAAFAGLARVLRPGGRIAFTAWRERHLSSARYVPQDALAPWVAPAPTPVGQPGAFAFADADRVRALLTGAGLRDVAVEALTVPFLAGTDAVDAAAFQIAEEDAELDEPLPRAATEAMVAAMRPYETPGGVLLEAATWLVSATR